MRHEKEATMSIEQPSPVMPPWFAGLIQTLEEIETDLAIEDDAAPEDMMTAFISFAAEMLVRNGASRSEALRAITCCAKAALFSRANELTGVAPAMGSA